jgi:NTP pyrophosphatase (non-canonical NTP hydrolase)
MSEIDIDKILKIRDILLKNSKEVRTGHAIEEMAELIVALKHLKRNKATIKDVSDEVADVLITVIYLSDIYDVNQVNKKIDEQYKRWSNV